MKSGRTLLILAAVVITDQAEGLAGQSAPFDEFRDWASARAIAIEGMGFGTDLTELEPLDSIIGSARLIAISEPFHGTHEPLALRNRLIEYLVERHELTAVALETGLPTSKPLYDYVLGGAGDVSSMAIDAFSYEFGNFQENVDLLEWLRSYNRQAPPGRRVRLYGVDLAGQENPYAHRSLEAVQAYLETADAELADSVRPMLEFLIPIFNSESYVELTQQERDRITVGIDDLIAFLDRERADLVQASSLDDYEWAHRQAIGAWQDNAFLRASPNGSARPIAMAENLRWVLEREGPRGRVLFFANNTHTGAHRFQPGSDAPESWPAAGMASAGLLLKQVLGSDMVTIGTYFGSADESYWYWGENRRAFPPDEDGMDALLGSIALSTYVIDLRTLPAAGPLARWMRSEHDFRIFDRFHLRYAPAEMFDAILYIDRLTSAVQQPR